MKETQWRTVFLSAWIYSKYKLESQINHNRLSQLHSGVTRSLRVWLCGKLCEENVSTQWIDWHPQCATIKSGVSLSVSRWKIFQRELFSFNKTEWSHICGFSQVAITTAECWDFGVRVSGSAGGPKSINPSIHASSVQIQPVHNYGGGGLKMSPAASARD